MKELERFQMNMKYYREKNNWSQERLADLLNVSRSVITRLESGEQEPDLSYLLSLSEVFQVSIGHLIGKDNQTNQYLYEVYGKYETEESFLHIIDYLVKQPKMASMLQQLLLAKTKDRKLIEDILVSVVEKATKISE
ncbi:helix-turn-helix domain-containing protein [Bacillus weihaiensis]|nr:helix-turn-helix transcriptional regulator [Bacillus weihaiensis]